MNPPAPATAREVRSGIVGESVRARQFECLGSDPHLAVSLYECKLCNCTAAWCTGHGLNG
eukprot:3642304-Rhodomonas_salina.6